MKTLKFLGIVLLIISAIVLFILFINDELPKWLTFIISFAFIGFAIHALIKDAVKSAIEESTNNIIEKLDEISDKLSSEDLLTDDQ